MCKNCYLIILYASCLPNHGFLLHFSGWSCCTVSHILFGESHLTHALQERNSCLHFLLWFVVDTIISIVLQILKYDSFHLKFPFHPSCNHFTQLFDCGGWWWFMVKTVDVMIWWLPNQETQERIGTMTSKTNFPLH